MTLDKLIEKQEWKRSNGRKFKTIVIPIFNPFTDEEAGVIWIAYWNDGVITVIVRDVNGHETAFYEYDESETDQVIDFHKWQKKVQKQIIEL